MKRTIIAAALGLALAAPVALGQEADAETRFHRAYEQEVVEGKLADAAKVYLSLMNDKATPERLRFEAKFRFAVTTVLLGRADEARVHFADLAKDTATPESLRARAAEYLDAAKGIGVGSELDRKLQSLVFDLAKDKEPTPAAYRDFEVIGKPAVPFLRRLLQHDDAALRWHAFRILLRMGEPGMAEAWTPKLSTNNMYVQLELARYVDERPDEFAVLEGKLLALDTEELRTTLGANTYLRPQFSAEALRALAARKIEPNRLLAWFPTKWTVEIDRVRGEWIAGDDAELSAEATRSCLRFVGSLPDGNIALRTDLFSVIVARLATLRLDWRPSEWNLQKGNEPGRPEFVGFARLGSTISPDTLLDTLAAVVERAVAGAAGPTDPLNSGLADALAIAYEQRDADAELPARYADVLKSWFTAASRRSYEIVNPFALRMRSTLSRLPPGAAESLAVWVLTTPDVRVNQAIRAQSIPTLRPRDVPIALAAMRAAGTQETREVLVQSLSLRNDATTHDSSLDYVRAIAPALAEIVRLWATSPSSNETPLRKLVPYMKVLPVEEARERFVEVATAVAEIPDAKQRQGSLTSHVLGIPGPSGADRSSYWTDVVLPSLPRVWDKFAASDRGAVLTSLLTLLEKPREPKLSEAIAGFVCEHYEEVPDYAVYIIANSPDLFPVTAWVPRVQLSADNRAKIAPERADPAVLEMTKDAAAASDNALLFTSRWASPKLKAEVFDRLLRTVPLDRLDEVVGYSVRMASPGAQEDALGRVMASDKPDLDIVGTLVSEIAARRPSERLYPAVRLLLASPEKGHVLEGIDAAKRLGREEMLPALALVLDSMDADLRQSAKEAIDAIVDLRKLKEEARKKADGR